MDEKSKQHMHLFFDEFEYYGHEERLCYYNSYVEALNCIKHKADFTDNLLDLIEDRFICGDTTKLLHFWVSLAERANVDPEYIDIERILLCNILLVFARFYPIINWEDEPYLLLNISRPNWALNIEEQPEIHLEIFNCLAMNLPKGSCLYLRILRDAYNYVGTNTQLVMKLVSDFELEDFNSSPISRYSWACFWVRATFCHPELKKRFLEINTEHDFWKALQAFPPELEIFDYEYANQMHALYFLVAVFPELGIVSTAVKSAVAHITHNNNNRKIISNRCFEFVYITLPHSKQRIALLNAFPEELHNNYWFFNFAIRDFLHSNNREVVEKIIDHQAANGFIRMILQADHRTAQPAWLPLLFRLLSVPDTNDLHEISHCSSYATKVLFLFQSPVNFSLLQHAVKHLKTCLNSSCAAYELASDTAHKISIVLEALFYTEGLFVNQFMHAYGSKMEPDDRRKEDDGFVKNFRQLLCENLKHNIDYRSIGCQHILRQMLRSLIAGEVNTEFLNINLPSANGYITYNVRREFKQKFMQAFGSLFHTTHTLKAGCLAEFPALRMR